ncbi:MAG: hypothetical protein J7K15_10630 [Deltaproteobacteria bacterium]|nr:hypothetical protein [Deltaproteobacteria bacterium]
MSDDLTLFFSPELKDVVQDMRELLSQSRLAFLLGAGCSKNAGLPLMPELTDEVLGQVKTGDMQIKKVYRVKGSKSGRRIICREAALLEPAAAVDCARRQASLPTCSRLIRGDYAPGLKKHIHILH